MNKKSIIKSIISLIAIVILVCIDQFTKHLVATNMDLYESIPLIPKVFELQYIQNTGAAWGMLAGKQIFLIIFSAILMLIGIYVYFSMEKQSKSYLPLQICIVFVIAGAIGNMIDRVFNHFVVDFFYFVLINFPVFNVADIFVTVPIFFAIILLFTKYKDDEFVFLNPFSKQR